MASPLYPSLFLLFLLTCTNCYRLPGTWTLRSSEIPELAGLRSPIDFTFTKQPTNTTHIQQKLTVRSCRQLQYSYKVYNDEIYFNFVSMGPLIRGCLRGELAYLRTKIDTIFYFYTLNGILLLLPPNGQLPVKLDRQLQPSHSINGVWRITDGVFFGRVTDPLVISNGPELALCKGKALYSVKIKGPALIEIKEVAKSQCNGILESSLVKAAFYRVKEGQEKVVSLYNGNVDLIVELTMDGEYRYGAEIDFRGVELKSKGVDRFAELAGSDPFNGGSASSAGVQTGTKNAETLNKTNPVTIANTSKTGSTATANSSQTAANNRSTTATTTTTAQQSTPTVQSKPSSSAASQQNTSSQQPRTTQAQPSQPSFQPSSSASSASSPPSTSSLSSPSALVLPSSYSIATTSNDLIGIWYPHLPTSLPSLSSYPPSAFLPYQIIINPTRIMISGGCNTIFTSYTFNKGTLTNLNPISTKKQCPVDRDSVLSDILLSTNVYHIGKSSNAKIIQVKSKQGALLLQLIDRPPQ